MTPAARLSLAQDFFRFAYRVGGPISFGLKFPIPELPAVTVFGEHTFADTDFQIDEETFELCGTLLERFAYRLLAIEMDSALEEKFGHRKNRTNHADDFVRNTCIIVWLIRNAVAHDLFEPIWKIDDPYFQNKTFSIHNLITIDTSGLNGQLVRRMDFGGPFALFKVSKMIIPLVS